MPEASLKINTSGSRANIVALAIPADTYVTPFMFDQAVDAARALPAGWFTTSLVLHEAGGARKDHVMLTRVAGPPVGNFNICRATRGRFIVVHLGEMDEDGDSPESGPYRTIEAAVEAIRADVEAQMAAWGVMPAPCAA